MHPEVNKKILTWTLTLLIFTNLYKRKRSILDEKKKDLFEGHLKGSILSDNLHLYFMEVWTSDRLEIKE